MLSCGQFLDEFGRYLDGDVGDDLRRELELHLAHCRTCQVLADSTGKTLRIVTEAGAIDLSESLPQPLVARIMERVEKAKPDDAGSGE